MLLTKAGDGGGGAESTRREREGRPHAAVARGHTAAMG